MDASIPTAHYGQVVGLLEVLDDFGGKADLAKIAEDMVLELDDILPASDSAEILGLAKVDSGDITLTDKGKNFLAAGIRRRQKIIQQKLLELDVFRSVLELIRRSDQNGVKRDALLAFLRSKIPETDSELCFRWIIEWGRYGLLIRYDSNDQRVRMVHGRGI